MDHQISIIIPNYNGAAHLRMCLDSVLNQTYKNIEIIVIDDASEDESCEIIQEYAKRDVRVCGILKTTNEGVSLARNAGLDAASGAYILFVDGDDWIDEKTCETAIETAKRTQADVVMWSYIRELGCESRPTEIFPEDRFFDQNEVRQNLYRRMVGAHSELLRRPERADALSTVWGKLYRRELIEQAGIRFEDIRKTGTYEDGLFNLEFFYHCKQAVFLNQYLYHYRRNQDSSITTAYKPNLPQKWHVLFDLIHAHLQTHQMEPLFYQSLNNRIALSLIQLGINEMECQAKAPVIIRNLRAILCDPVYRRAIMQLDISPMPIHWKVFYICARRDCSMAVYALLAIIQKIRGR